MRQWIPYPAGYDRVHIENYPASRGVELVWEEPPKVLSIRDQIFILFNQEIEKMRNEMERRLKSLGL